MNQSISILIAAYNEEDRIEETLKSVKCINRLKEIIVVDDGSEDQTYDKAKKFADKVIRLERNRGKGMALNQGLKEVTGEVVVLLDADVKESAKEVLKLVEPVLNGDTDMSIAKFPAPKKRGGIGLVKGLATWGLKKLTDQEFSTPLSGQRALSRAVLERVTTLADGFGVEVALTIDVCRAGFRVMEVPVNMSHRETGRTFKDIIHRGKQFRDVAKVILIKLRR